MRRFIIGSVVLGLWIAIPIQAAAQPRVPYSGTSAIGIDVGSFLPSGDAFDAAPLINVLYEHYLTSRLSLGGGFGWTDPSFKPGFRPTFRPDFTNGGHSLRQAPLRAEINYNWEGGRWHPFIGTGIGIYFLRLIVDNDIRGIDETQTKFGLNTGGGIEYFLNRSAALKFEGRYHAVADTDVGLDPSGMALSAGLKAYF